MTQLIVYSDGEKRDNYSVCLGLDLQCPRCKVNLVAFKFNKKGDMVVCPNWSCALYANPVDKKAHGLPDFLVSKEEKR